MHYAITCHTIFELKYGEREYKKTHTTHTQQVTYIHRYTQHTQRHHSFTQLK